MEMCQIINARIVTPESVIENGSLVINDGRIVDISKSSESDAGISTIDAAGALVIPGIVDIHTDALDHEIVPRSGADFPIQIAFYELERKMAACGITTVYHSMHLGYEKAEKNSQSKYTREELFETVAKLCNTSTIINNMIHLRFEITGPYHYDLVKELIEKEMVQLVSFMDHTPGQGQYSREEFIKRFVNSGMTEEEATEKYELEKHSDKVSNEDLQVLAELCKAKGITIASHDDDTAEKVNMMYDMGINISEFPVSEEASSTAVEKGMFTVGGGANVLRGGSLTGNLNIQDAIEKGLINCLSSDYYPPSLIHSVFKLTREGSTDIQKAVDLVATNPAKSVRIDNVTGSIEVGKNADLIVVDASEEYPVIKHVFVNGVQALTATPSHKLEAELA